ncbi:MAG: hypothetical protein ACKVE3_02290 [Dissulfuribacterales bacterium]
MDTKACFLNKLPYQFLLAQVVTVLEYLLKQDIFGMRTVGLFLPYRNALSPSIPKPALDIIVLPLLPKAPLATKHHFCP